ARQADTRSWLAFSAGLSWAVTKADHLIGLADVEIISAKDHSKRQSEAIAEDEALADAATVCTCPQNGDAAGARFGDKDVSIGRLRHPARPAQISGKFTDDEAGRQMQTCIGGLFC